MPQISPMNWCMIILLFILSMSIMKTSFAPIMKPTSYKTFQMNKKKHFLW